MAVDAQHEQREGGLGVAALNEVEVTLAITWRIEPARSSCSALEWEIIDVIPPGKWLRVPPQKFDFLSFEEAAGLVEAADAGWRAAILVGLRAGLRLGEIMALRWEDLDLVAGRLVVNRTVSRGRIGSPKNGRTREIPLGLDVLRSLKQHGHLKGEFVFPVPGGRLLHRNETKHPLWRACRRAGLRRIGWHVLRHSFASHLVMRGAPIRGVQGSSRVANSRENDADGATEDDAKRREVSASVPVAPPATTADTDAAIRTAAKVAIDAADYRRARALLDLLETKTEEKRPIVAFAPKRAPA